MMKFAVAASLLLATSTLTSAQSDGNPVGQDVASPAKGRVDSDTQEAIEFSDPGNATAKAFAAVMGISIGEATSRQRSQARLARVN